MRRKLLMAALLAAPFSGSVLAAGDPAAGEIKAYTCTGCHGIPGYKNIYPTYKVPKLGGQNATYIVAALNAYKTGERQHRTMNLHAEGLSQQDMEDIAAFLESYGSEAGGEGE